jgi:hypothetical protein
MFIRHVEGTGNRSDLDLPPIEPDDGLRRGLSLLDLIAFGIME